MKRKILFMATTALTCFLSSCGVDENSIIEVKLIPVKNGKEYQYIDQEGKIVINPQFSDATVFRDGLALVKNTGDEPKFGFISEDGKYTISPQYMQATVFSDGLAWVVTENAAPSAINKKGELQFMLQDAEEVRLFKNGLAAFSIISEDGEEKWGFVNTVGKIVINPQFSSVSNFSEGKCGVRNNEGKWGFIDKEGKVIINFQFEGTNDFKNDLCIVISGNKKGIINKDGKYIINPQYLDMKIDGDMYLINQDGKWGWADKDGKITINPQFGDAYPFLENKTTSVQSGNKYGFIDRKGSIVINPQFDQALPFNGKLAVIVSSNKIGFIDTEGKYVINPQFDGISRDVVTYFLSGDSEFGSVNTDYFNVGAIASILNLDNPEGFTFNSTFEDVRKKYDLAENDFSRYGTEKEVVSNKKITNDASYNFYVLGKAFDYNEDYDLEFSRTNKPYAYAYIISLSGRGANKNEGVISAIQGKLTGFKKNEENGVDNLEYNDGKKTIQIRESSRGDIVVVISNKQIDEEGDDGEI